jgi:hypothetical protein
VIAIETEGIELRLAVPHLRFPQEHSRVGFSPLRLPVSPRPHRVSVLPGVKETLKPGFGTDRLNHS